MKYTTLRPSLPAKAAIYASASTRHGVRFFTAQENLIAQVVIQIHEIISIYISILWRLAPMV